MAYPPHSPLSVFGHRPRRGVAAWLVLLAVVGLMGLGPNASADVLAPGDESVARSEREGDHFGQPSSAGPERHPIGVREAAPTIGLPSLTFLLGLADRFALALAPTTASKGCRGHPADDLSCSPHPVRFVRAVRPLRAAAAANGNANA